MADRIFIILISTESRVNHSASQVDLEVWSAWLLETPVHESLRVNALESSFF